MTWAQVLVARLGEAGEEFLLEPREQVRGEHADVWHADDVNPVAAGSEEDGRTRLVARTVRPAARTG
ncbi:hypothetical protein GCM10011609_56080 [Lentzea pudingi]|uniref:Uncharacterized protein n=1 Tax=Lentzea pudingi TaxID=1789439 RepID=A0ABQ2II73_9PSEU|nr:hypothetical protein GCM10011609_56080 [Lentzea pudingi]